jgi:hypothetical protein
LKPFDLRSSILDPRSSILDLRDAEGNLGVIVVGQIKPSRAQARKVRFIEITPLDPLKALQGQLGMLLGRLEG